MFYQNPLTTISQYFANIQREMDEIKLLNGSINLNSLTVVLT